MFFTWAKIIEATGKIHQDVNLRYQEWLTMGYAQRFVKGDFVKFTYPDFPRKEDSSFPIKIEKLDNNINSKLFTGTDFNNLLTIPFDNCENPTYIMLEGYFTDRPVYFKALIHSGEFTAKYKINEYTGDEKEFINNNMKEFDINNILKLPNQYYRNIVELKCKTPGLITIF